VTPRYALVLFDLDGTLVDTAPEIAAAANGALIGAGYPAVEEADVRRWIGQGTHRLMVRAVAHVTGTGESEAGALPGFAAAMAAFEEHYAKVAGRDSGVYHGVPDALRSIRAMGIATAVLTNKPGRFTRIILDAHGLSALLDAVVSGDTLPQKKPHPGGIEHLLARFAVPRERALMIGDSETDVATARAAGIDVWAVPYGYNHGQPVEVAKPDRIVETLGEAARALAGLA